MNPVYYRMVLYFLAPLAALVPGIDYNNENQTLVVQLDSLAFSLPVAAAAVAGIFAGWGRK